MKEILPGVYLMKKKLYTKNLTPGKTTYNEKLFREHNEEYRQWDPKKSKLCAAMMKRMEKTGLDKKTKVLYLGASSGTTPSHVSDIVTEGIVYAMDFAPRVVRDLTMLAEHRRNIIPILADANHPEQYMGQIADVDLVYMDIAQKNQAEIFIKNCRMFLGKGQLGLLAVKARSIDVTKQPTKVFNIVREQLKPIFKILDFKELDPFEKDHCMFLCELK